MKTWRQGIAVLAMLAIGAVTARADDAGPTVTVSGHATAPEKAQILRLTLLVSAQGSDIHDAAAKLKQERDDLTAKLAAIGVSQNAIKFSGPVEGNQSAMTPQQQMIQRMMMARNRQTPTTGPSGSTIWRDGRVAEGDGLLNRYTESNPYPGFESPSLRFPRQD
jgi:hypothetical protein